jgi:hypothetical protein
VDEPCGPDLDAFERHAAGLADRVLPPADPPLRGRSRGQPEKRSGVAPQERELDLVPLRFHLGRRALVRGQADHHIAQLRGRVEKCGRVRSG